MYVIKIDDDYVDIMVIYKSGNVGDVFYGLLKFVVIIG